MKWISIKDKLPAPNTEIIVGDCANGYVCFGYYGKISENTCLDDPHDFFVLGLEGCEYPDDYMNITHWMQMPELKDYSG